VPTEAAFPPKAPDVAAPNVPGLRAPKALPDGVGVVDPKVPGPGVPGLDNTVVPGVTALVSPLGPTTIEVVPGGATVMGFPGLVTTVCPLAKTPMDCVPGMALLADAMVAVVPGKTPPGTVPPV